MPLKGELEKRKIRTLAYYVYGLHKKSRLYRLQAAVGVLRACVEFRPEVIYLNQCGSYKVTLPAATIFNLPIVAHIRIFEDAAYLAMQNPSPHRLRGIIAISSAVEKEIRRFRQLDPIQLHRVYDGYASAVRVPSNGREGTGRNRIACVGRLVPVKGQDVLINALCLLKNFEIKGECIFVGDGDEGFVHDLRRMAASGDSPFVTQWVGFVSDVLSLLATCSVLVCPSHHEPLGRVILEAWDAGVVPVVFAGSGGAAEIVAAADGGILYDEQKPSSLARALRQALELDPESRERFVNNGRSWTRRNCDPGAYGRLVSGILSNVG
jgi:glycosyltransferase involved in cell wall biosynthesis